MLTGPAVDPLLETLASLTRQALEAVRILDHEGAARHVAERGPVLEEIRNRWPDLDTAPAVVRETLERVKAWDAEMATQMSRQRSELRAHPSSEVVGGYRAGFAPATVVSRRA